MNWVKELWKRYKVGREAARLNHRDNWERTNVTRWRLANTLDEIEYHVLERMHLNVVTGERVWYTCHLPFGGPEHRLLNKNTGEDITADHPLRKRFLK